MRSNVLLKFLIPAVLLSVILIVFVFQPKKPRNKTTSEDIVLTREEARELGIEGDTPADTLRTIVGEMRHLRAQIDVAKTQNEKLSSENQSLEQLSKNWERRLEQIEQRANEEAEAAKSEAQQLSEQMMNMLGDMEGRFSLSRRSQEIPIGLGLEDSNKPARQDPVMWIEPSDAVTLDKRGARTSQQFAFPSNFTNPLDGSLLDKQQAETQAALGGRPTTTTGKKADRNTDTKPVYTIAENSTLFGSTTMTALIGRVPVDGTVSDPYPFKVLIGKDNLAANGIELPEVQGAIISGTTQGDWTLSCVRGQVETITFIFDDGTIRTVPEPEKIVRRSNNQSKGSIGYISDAFGIPCISGARKSNAKEYIGNNALITAAGAAIARTFSKDGNRVEVSTSGSTTITDNNQAFNAILQRGVGDIQDWVNKMYGQAFAAVYVPPHQQVAVHIEREIAIDFEQFGRKVRHDEQVIETVLLD